MASWLNLKGMCFLLPPHLCSCVPLIQPFLFSINKNHVSFIPYLDLSYTPFKHALEITMITFFKIINYFMLIHNTYHLISFALPSLRCGNWHVKTSFTSYVSVFKTIFTILHMTQIRESFQMPLHLILNWQLLLIPPLQHPSRTCFCLHCYCQSYLPLLSELLQPPQYSLLKFLYPHTLRLTCPQSIHSNKKPISRDSE